MKHKQNGGGGGVTYLNRRGVGIVFNIFGIFEKMLREAQGGIIIDQFSSMDIKEGTLKNMGGVCGVVMPKYFYGFEKMLGGLCQNILWGVEIVWGVEKCLGGMPTNFVHGFEKKNWGGGYAAAC